MKKKASSPTNDEIEELLRGFKPLPTQHYYHKMEGAPWKASSRRTIISRAKFYPARSWLLAGLALFLLLGALVLVPPVQTLAGKLLQFFLPAGTDKMQVVLTATQTSQAPPPSIDDCPFTFDQAEQQAGFQILSFTPSETDLAFSGARYDAQLEAVTSCYAVEGYHLYFTQRKLGSIQEYSSVGASAPVESVTVRGVSGEYVAGGWRTSNSQQTIDQMHITPDASLDLIWDSSLSQRILRWQENGFSFEILTTGNATLQKSDLINLAERVK